MISASKLTTCYKPKIHKVLFPRLRWYRKATEQTVLMALGGFLHWLRLLKLCRESSNARSVALVLVEECFVGSKTLPAVQDRCGLSLGTRLPG